TRPKIARQQEEATSAALSQVLPQARTFQTQEHDSLWVGLDEAGSKVGIVMRVASRGYGGPVPVLAGVDTAGWIVGIRFAGAAEGLKETPGLGLKVLEPWFGQQFLGKTTSELKLRKDGGSIDAITGATITTRAVLNGLKHGLEKYDFRPAGASGAVPGLAVPQEPKP
ncbi:MAG: FMN-binding protein, partial [candidate division WOR-3 bacterium]